MNNQPTVLQPATRRQRFMHHPLTRMVLAFLLVILLVILSQIMFALFGSSLGIAAEPLFNLIATILTVIFVYTGYSAYVRRFEQRPVTELGRAGALRELGLGLLVGAGLFSITILLIWLLGGYQFTFSTAALPAIISTLSLSIASGFLEELVFRGVIFRNLELTLGSWWALALSSLFFGIAHGANPGATLISSLAIALEAGVLLGALYLLTRRLWLAIGMHLAWNFTQGGIFGVPVSGNVTPGLLTGQPHGSDLLSGGRFGAEASIVALAVCLITGVIVLMHMQRAGGMINHKKRAQV